jgi:hypothetical protein
MVTNRTICGNRRAAPSSDLWSSPAPKGGFYSGKTLSVSLRKPLRGGKIMACGKMAGERLC